MGLSPLYSRKLMGDTASCCGHTGDPSDALCSLIALSAYVWQLPSLIFPWTYQTYWNQSQCGLPARGREQEDGASLPALGGIGGTASPAKDPAGWARRRLQGCHKCDSANQWAVISAASSKWLWGCGVLVQIKQLHSGHSLPPGIFMLVSGHAQRQSALPCLCRCLSSVI